MITLRLTDAEVGALLLAIQAGTLGEEELVRCYAHIPEEQKPLIRKFERFKQLTGAILRKVAAAEAAKEER